MQNPHKGHQEPGIDWVFTRGACASKHGVCFVFASRLLLHEQACSPCATAGVVSLSVISFFTISIWCNGLSRPAPCTYRTPARSPCAAAGVVFLSVIHYLRLVSGALAVSKAVFSFVKVVPAFLRVNLLVKSVFLRVNLENRIKIDSFSPVIARPSTCSRLWISHSRLRMTPVYGAGPGPRAP